MKIVETRREGFSCGHNKNGELVEGKYLYILSCIWTMDYGQLPI
jgi:hypothetical protein